MTAARQLWENASSQARLVAVLVAALLTMSLAYTITSVVDRQEPAKAGRGAGIEIGTRLRADDAKATPEDVAVQCQEAGEHEGHVGTDFDAFAEACQRVARAMLD